MGSNFGTIRPTVAEVWESASAARGGGVLLREVVAVYLVRLAILVYVEMYCKKDGDFCTCGTARH